MPAPRSLHGRCPVTCRHPPPPLHWPPPPPPPPPPDAARPCHRRRRPQGRRLPPAARCPGQAADGERRRGQPGVLRGRGCPRPRAAPGLRTTGAVGPARRDPAQGPRRPADRPRGAGVRGRPADVTGGGGLPGAPGGAGRRRPVAAARPVGSTGRRPAGRRPRGHQRPREPRCDLPQRRQPRPRRRAALAPLLRSPLPAVRAGLDGSRAGRAVDAAGALAGGHRDRAPGGLHGGRPDAVGRRRTAERLGPGPRRAHRHPPRGPRARASPPPPWRPPTAD